MAPMAGAKAAIARILAQTDLPGTTSSEQIGAVRRELAEGLSETRTELSRHIRCSPPRHERWARWS
jgi:hypothetical protein